MSVPQLDLCEMRDASLLWFAVFAKGSLKSIVDSEIVRDGITFSFRTRKGCATTDADDKRELDDTARWYFSRCVPVEDITCSCSGIETSSHGGKDGVVCTRLVVLLDMLTHGALAEAPKIVCTG